MSFLHPLFLAALAAVAVPVLLHLARRRTQRELPFSSLRFLHPVPPRLERRRRLEHWLLLLLRAGAVALLAATFARPFFTRALPGLPAAAGERTVLLLDVSASMRREGLWPALVARARQHLERAAPGDRLAMLAFDGRVRTLISFEHWASLPAAKRAPEALARLAALGPGWGLTDLGSALVAAAEQVADDRESVSALASAERVVLLGDLAEGARLTALGPGEWPAGLRLELERLDPAAGGDNVGLQLVPTATDGAPAEGERPRVRILAGSARALSVRQVRLAWQDGAGSTSEIPLPAGESPVVDAPARPAGAATLVLQGDAHEFDNRLAVAPPSPAPSGILYVGTDDPKDAGAPLYFLSRAFPGTRTRAPKVEVRRPEDAALPRAVAGADLIVMVDPVAGPAAGAIKTALERGRVVLFAPRSADGVGATLAALTGGPAASVREAPAGREAVLTQVDLRDPLLAPFADGRAADFTRIRFWKRRLVDAASLPAGARMLARFDDGSPAWVVWPRGRGLVLLMTSGLGTADSQLALSSKLVPLLWSLLEASSGPASAPTQFLVGERIPLPRGADGEVASTVQTPGGQRLPLPAGTTHFDGADEPGLYRFGTDASAAVVAVNVPPSESATGLLPVELLERAGIPVVESGPGAAARAAARGQSGPAAPGEAERRAAFFAELEGRQKPWRWVLLAVLLVLIGETWLAGRAARIQNTAGERST